MPEGTFLFKVLEGEDGECVGLVLGVGKEKCPAETSSVWVWAGKFAAETAWLCPGHSAWATGAS